MDIIKAIPANSKVFAKLDAVLGYHQMHLDDQNKKLTTFLLPSGCYYYICGPMGLASSGDEMCFCSEVVITGIPCTSKIVDDILVAAKDYA